jgi:hypothetical protein
MAKNNSRAGGGIRSRQLVEPGVRTGQARREINPKAVSQIGSSMGNRATDSRRTVNSAENLVGQRRIASPPLGNELAARTQARPGGSRDVSKSGSQSTHGAVNPGQPRPGANKPIFPGFR